MLQGEHSAILSTFIKLPFVIKIFCFVFFRVAVLHRFYCRKNKFLTFQKANNKGADAQAGLHLCCLRATKSGFFHTEAHITQNTPRVKFYIQSQTIPDIENLL